MPGYLRTWTLPAAALVGVLALFPTAVAAQTPTGTITGRLTDSTAQPMADVDVTAESVSLQQALHTTTSSNGDYIFKLLPPGRYQVSFSRPGFRPLTESRDVAITQSVIINAVMQPATITENVNVVAAGTLFFEGVTSATTIRQPVLSALPTRRSLVSAVELAPNVHATGPDGAFSISGAMTFDSVFRVNGVQIQDNVFGLPNELFIEDAIAETTVTTSGMQAEEGRFAGGIVNVVTKSGGDTPSGSFRVGLTNDNWRTVSPFAESKTDATQPNYEFTAGGPLVPSNTWFFAAGRFIEQTSAQETAFTALPYDLTINEKRFEGKVTQAFGARHRLQIGYTGIERKEDNYAREPILDLASLEQRELPQNLLSVHYTGMLGPRLFLEGQFSSRNYSFEHSGATSRDPILGTYMLDGSTNASWWSPFGCAICGAEERDGTEIAVKGSYLLSKRGGAHNLVFGYNTFDDQVAGDIHQAGSDRWIITTSSLFDGSSVYPIIEGGPFGFTTLIVDWPLSGSGTRTAFRTHSLFAQDAWTVNRHLSLNLGIRYDRNDGRNSSKALVASGSAISPRLGLAWDPRGNGRTVLTASAGRYVTAISNGIANSTTTAGKASIFVYAYQGPDINLDESQPLVSTDAAIATVFDWFAHEPSPILLQATIPGFETQIRQPLKSPHSDELAAGVTQQIGSRGAVRVDVMSRRFGNFYAARADRSTGFVSDDFGFVYDLTLLENTDAVTRRYEALTTQIDLRLGPVNVGGNYTLSRLHGNANGETLANGPVTSDILRYPEFFDPSWSFPEGDLAADQRHRARIWGNWQVPLGDSANALSLVVLEQIQTGTPYGAVANIDSSPYVTNAPAYAQPPISQVSYYFTAPDAFRTETMMRTDLAINFSRRFGTDRRVELFVQAQVLNAFNQFAAFNLTGEEINTRTLTAVDSPARFAPFDPFTETPVEGVHWAKGSRFGTVIDKDAYTTPRTFRCSFGFRF